MSSDVAAHGPLHGVTILDLTSVGMGPYATQLLGDMGADVIKIESSDGDLFRHVAPSMHPGMSAAYMQLNRNKRSVVLDLKNVGDVNVFRNLLSTADVLVSSIRASAMRRLGLSYEDLQPFHPRLIYCSLCGFSERGRYAGRPAFDDIIQALSGLAGLQGRAQSGEPAYVNTVLADKVTGLAAAHAISMALYEREKSGLGQAIEVPMFETLVSFNLIEHMAGATFGQSTAPMGYGRVLSPYRKPYRTSDGYIGLLPYTTEQWRRFFDLSGHPEHASNPEFMDPALRADNIGRMYELLETIVLERTTQEWLDLLARADIPAAPVLSLEDLMQDPHLRDVGFFRRFEHPTEGPITLLDIPTRFSRTPGSIRRLPPVLDQDGPDVRSKIPEGK